MKKLILAGVLLTSVAMGAQAQQDTTHRKHDMQHKKMQGDSARMKNWKSDTTHMNKQYPKKRRTDSTGTKQ